MRIPRLALVLLCGWAWSPMAFAGGVDVPANQTLALTLGKASPSPVAMAHAFFSLSS